MCIASSSTYAPSSGSGTLETRRGEDTEWRRGRCGKCTMLRVSVHARKRHNGTLAICIHYARARDHRAASRLSLSLSLSCFAPRGASGLPSRRFRWRRREHFVLGVSHGSRFGTHDGPKVSLNTAAVVLSPLNPPRDCTARFSARVDGRVDAAPRLLAECACFAVARAFIGRTPRRSIADESDRAISAANDAPRDENPNPVSQSA